MQYLFALGRNPQLSMEEIKSHFENSNRINGILVSKNGAIVELEKKLPEKIISSLGGTIAIGEVLASGKISEIKKQLEKREIYFGTKNNFSYAIWDFADEEFYDSVSGYVKERFKGERFKSSRKNPHGVLALQSGEKIRIPSSLVEEEYFAFSSGGKNFFGRIIEKTNYSEIEERDMNKSMRREKLAISPRLAKIMINLSEASEGQTLVDPFCGIGAILQEALIKKIKVIGIDRDAEALDGARQNLEWGKFKKENYSLLNSDSSKARIANSNVLVTEPDLGETLKKPASNEKAAEILSAYEDLVIRVLNNLKGEISGRFVFTSPLIKIADRKRKGCNEGNILSKTGLKIAGNFPVDEFRENQIVGRRIFVLEK